MAILSLLALVFAIVLGALRPKLNIGLVALTLAYAIGFFVAGMKESEIASAFPSHLFLMLIGITALFEIAQQNGTLQIVSNLSVRFVGSRPALLPVVFFLMSFGLAAMGPGNIAAVALLAPVGMSAANRAKVSPMLMTVALCTGANAGAFSPIAPTGIIMLGLMQKIGIESERLPWLVFLASAFLQTMSALLAYVLFGGWRVPRTNEFPAPTVPLTPNEFISKVQRFSQKVALRLRKRQWLTLLAPALLVVGVLFFKIPVGTGAFILTLFLLLINAADGERVLKSLPWETLLMVTGVSVLIGLLEKTGGLFLATNLLAQIASVNWINALLAFITGIISAYSSSSGVVLPTFVPLIPSLIEKLGGGNAIEMLIAIAVGSHMVDVSPLSVLGTLCIAATPEEAEQRKLFRPLLLWGFAMALVSAVLAFIFLDLFNWVAG
ncbi:MAG TPA: SLC13 family permease [Anaerolineales bacterium]|nr:SLC13 family permease [Anaerolineales bacterium]